MSLTVLDVTEQLYSAKLFIVVMSFFNLIINLFSTYALVLSGLGFLALLSAVVFVFNVLCFSAAFMNWKKKNPSERVVLEVKKL